MMKSAKRSSRKTPSKNAKGIGKAKATKKPTKGVGKAKATKKPTKGVGKAKATKNPTKSVGKAKATKKAIKGIRKAKATTNSKAGERAEKSPPTLTSGALPPVASPPPEESAGTCPTCCGPLKMRVVVVMAEPDEDSTEGQIADHFAALESGDAGEWGIKVPQIYCPICEPPLKAALANRNQLRR